MNRNLARYVRISLLAPCLAAVAVAPTGADITGSAHDLSDELGVDDLPFYAGEERGAADSAQGLLRSAGGRRLSLREIEDLYIGQILEFTGGNKVQAAKILGIDRKTLYRRAERRAPRGSNDPA